MSKPALYLIDSFALAFRIFYAFVRTPLVNSKGETTSVAHGYWSGLARLLSVRKPTHFAIVKDPGGPNFRHELYPEYKANRSEMPEEMRVQLPMLEDLLQASGVPILMREGFEADDILASLAKQYGDQGIDVYLVTKDKDLTQMVNDHVKLLVMEKGGEFSEVGAAEVQEKWGVPPAQIRDLLSLMGDSSDNIPGVPKVGPKTAAELLVQYGDLDGIYANLDKVTKKALKANLSENKDKAYLSQQLVSLKTDMDMGLSLADFEYKGLNMQALEPMLAKYELHNLARQFKSLDNRERKGTAAVSAEPVASEGPEPEYVLVDNEDAWLRLEKEVADASLVALDTETDSLQSRKAKLVGLCVSCSEERGYYVPVGHQTAGNQDAERVRALLRAALAPGRTVVFHNAGFDLDVLAGFGVKAEGQVWDSMVGAWMLDPGYSGFGLDAQVKERLGHAMIPIESLLGKGKSQKTFDLLLPSEAYVYGAEDAVYTLRLWACVEPELRAKELLAAFVEQEMPLVPCLRSMEAAGVLVDCALLGEIGAELQLRLAQLEVEIWNHAGREFNINSPKQLAEILFVDLLLPGTKKTSTGFSTSADVLEELRDYHPIVVALLEYRELQKLKSTYVDTLPLLMDADTGRVHTSYLQIGTATGRLSSHEPNLQNIPIRTPLGKRIRAAFVAPPGKVLLSADYSQIELRVLAHLSGDEGLSNAFRQEIDVHTDTAAAVFGVPLEQVTADMRRQAKAVNFGVLYGMSAFRLARDFQISRAAAKEFIDGWFAHFGSVKQFIDATVASARELGYVSTLRGRRRYLPALGSPNHLERQNAERMAVNSPVQGSAADIIKMAMVEIYKETAAQGLDLKLLLQVHDELVFECPQEKAQEYAAFIKAKMEGAIALSVPLLVEVGVGKTWAEAH